MLRAKWSAVLTVQGNLRKICPEPTNADIGEFMFAIEERGTRDTSKLAHVTAL
jgi:hypothetical protein